MKFKEFWKRYSYGIVRIFVDQIAIAIFAAAVAFGTATKYMNLTVGSSFFSVFFLLFMVAELTFRTGVEDREKIALGRFEKNNLTGLYMGLLANIPNFVLAVIYAVISHIDSLQNVAGLANVIMKLIYGEYLGILTLEVGGTKLGLMPVSFFLMIVPPVIAAFLGYFLGANGIITPKPSKKDME